MQLNQFWLDVSNLLYTQCDIRFLPLCFMDIVGMAVGLNHGTKVQSFIYCFKRCFISIHVTLQAKRQNFINSIKINPEVLLQEIFKDLALPAQRSHSVY